MSPSSWPARALYTACLAVLALVQSPTNAVESPSRTVTEVFQAPRSWLGQAVRLRFQFGSELGTWTPYVTRFGAADYVSVEVWGDEQFLWESETFHHPVGVVFARRGGAAAAALSKAAPYGRFEGTAVVREIFLGLPWIELTAAEALYPSVSEGSILHATRALASMEDGRWSLALEDLERALSAGLPDHARAELERLVGVCRSARGDSAIGG